jgi:hypothetical protein
VGLTRLSTPRRCNNHTWPHTRAMHSSRRTCPAPWSCWRQQEKLACAALSLRAQRARSVERFPLTLPRRRPGSPRTSPPCPAISTASRRSPGAALRTRDVRAWSSCSGTPSRTLLPRARSQNVRAGYSNQNAKANEFLYRRVDIADAVEAHLLSAEIAPALGFERLIVSATTPFDQGDVAALAHDTPAVVGRAFPDQEREYQRRGWRMFPTLDRVYDNARARLVLGWARATTSGTCSTN